MCGCRLPRGKWHPPSSGKGSPCPLSSNAMQTAVCWDHARDRAVIRTRRRKRLAKVRIPVRLDIGPGQHDHPRAQYVRSGRLGTGQCLGPLVLLQTPSAIRQHCRGVAQAGAPCHCEVTHLFPWFSNTMETGSPGGCFRVPSSVATHASGAAIGCSTPRFQCTTARGIPNATGEGEWHNRDHCGPKTTLHRNRPVHASSRFAIRPPLPRRSGSRSEASRVMLRTRQNESPWRRQFFDTPTRAHAARITHPHGGSRRGYWE